MPEETKPVEREGFETWAQGPKLPLTRDGILYAEYMTQIAWMSWKARAALKGSR